MRQHERYLITGVVLAAELKELQGGGVPEEKGREGYSTSFSFAGPAGGA